MSTEFVKQSLRENLSRTLIPHIADGLWSIYDNAKTACIRNKQPGETLKTFQNLLTRVPQWTDEILNAEVSRIEKVSKCEYMEDLLLGVFVSYIRAFASLQQSDEAHVNIEFDRLVGATPVNLTLDELLELISARGGVDKLSASELERLKELTK